MYSSGVPNALRSLTILSVVLFVSTRADAVILFGSATRNTSAPTGTLSGSGWQFQGQFAGFLGTPISSKYFITAQHIGGSVGQDFQYDGNTYFTDQAVNIPNTDLRLWRISGTFPTWAPLYDPAVDGSERKKSLVVIGRGTQRGDPVYAPAVPVEPEPIPNPDNPVLNRDLGPTGQRLRGWRWGIEDRVQAWGQNVIADVFDTDDFGRLLYFTFDQDGGPNEAHLSAGDSGGAVFIKSGGVWKLAGINFAVDGPFRETPTSPEFLGALFDVTGMYFDNPPRAIAPAGGFAVPSGAYASAISGSLPFILSTINPPTFGGVPEPSSAVALALLALCRRRRQ